MGGMSVFAQGGYLTLVQRNAEASRKRSKEQQRQLQWTLQLLYVNSYNTLPFFVLVSIMLGEPAKIAAYEMLWDPGFASLFVTLVLSGCVLTYSQFLCAAVCSALTASLVGVAKSVLQTTVGFFTFGGVPFNPVNLTGIFLNTGGACLYSYVKFREGQAKSSPSKASLNGGAPGLTTNPSSMGLVMQGNVASETLGLARQYSGLYFEAKERSHLLRSVVDEEDAEEDGQQKS